MLRQLIFTELYCAGYAPERGYDYTTRQYVNWLKERLSAAIMSGNVNSDFFDLFCRKFFQTFNNIEINFDDAETFWDYLENDCESILPMYSKLFLAVKSIDESDLKTNDTMHTVQNGSQTSGAKAYSAKYPEQMIDHDSLEYATDGSISSGSGQSESVTDVTSATGSRLEHIQKLIDSQQNIIDKAVNQFKHLFTMIY